MVPALQDPGCVITAKAVRVGLAPDPDGGSYIGEQLGFANGGILFVAPNGIITTVVLYPGDVLGIVRDSGGNVFGSDASGNKIFKITSGDFSVIAGIGNANLGDGGPAGVALLRKPQGIGIDSHGNLLIADTENRVIRKVSSTTGLISNFAGNGTSGELRPTA